MKKFNQAFLLCLINGLSIFGSNPIANYYGNGNYPLWTDQINWANQINMQTYDFSVCANCSTEFNKFEFARDILSSQGGGVLYYPAGIYDFSDGPYDGPNGRGLMLKSGVAIVGETPTIDSNAIDGSLLLTTQFKFKYNKKVATVGGGNTPSDWNIIGITPTGTEQLKDIKNVGLCWVHLEGGTIYFGTQMLWGTNYKTSGSWMGYATFGEWANRVADGKHPLDPFCGAQAGTSIVGTGSGRFVFGCKIANAAVVNNAIDYGLTTKDGNSYPNTNFYFLWKFGARIQIYGSNVFIANNLLPKPDSVYKYQQTTCKVDQSKSGCSKRVCLSTPTSTLQFDYGMTFGIDCNKSLWNIASNKNSTLGYFIPNVIIRDNYIYNHGRKGIDASGEWVIIKNNYNKRNGLIGNSFGTETGGDNVYGLGSNWTLTLDGFDQTTPGGSGCISDNLSRAYDLCGRALWIDSNYYDYAVSSPGNDGEGILAQTDGGTSTLNSWAVTRNKGAGAYMAGYNITHYGSIFAWNTGASTYGTLNGGSLVDVAIVNNSTTPTATGDVLLSCPTGSLTPPTSISAFVSSDSTNITITWTDNATNEIGFRVEKKLATSGQWKTIAYRPRKSNGDINNEQKWIDYMPPTGVEVYYRVVAINCDDNSVGNSVESSPITISPKIITDNQQFVISKNAISIYPNPATNYININSAIPIIKIELFSLSGTKIAEYQNNSIDIQLLQKGIYLLVIKTSQSNFIEKIIKY